MRGRPTKCAGCQKAHDELPGARCAMHESSTSAVREKTIAGERAGWPVPSWTGPMLKGLSGYSARATVPRFDDVTGKRIYR